MNKKNADYLRGTAIDLDCHCADLDFESDAYIMAVTADDLLYIASGLIPGEKLLQTKREINATIKRLKQALEIAEAIDQSELKD